MLPTTIITTIKKAVHGRPAKATVLLCLVLVCACESASSDYTPVELTPGPSMVSEDVPLDPTVPETPSDDTTSTMLTEEPGEVAPMPPSPPEEQVVMVDDVEIEDVSSEASLELSITAVNACGAEEFFTLANDAAEPVELGGLVIRDRTARRGDLSPFTLPAGGVVRIYTGPTPADEVGAISLERQGSIWNNTGDSIYIDTADGRNLVTLTYEGCGEMVATSDGSDSPEPDTSDDNNPLTAVMNVAVVCLNLRGTGDEFGEYALLRNNNSAAVELRGLYLLDSGDNRLAIADSFSLAPGAIVQVYTGRNAPSGAIAIGRGTGIWNNTGDTARLFNSADQQLSLTSRECENTNGEGLMPPEMSTDTDPAPVVINVAVVCLSPSGSGDGFGEYVELRNDNAAAVQLKGLYLRDTSASNRLTIGDSFLLSRGGMVRVYTGRSAPTGAIAIGRGTGIWNESGDTARLFNSADQQLSSTRTECGDTSTSTPATPVPPVTNPPPAAMNVAVVCLSPSGSGDGFGEYVELRNDNSASVELKGLYLRDTSASNRLTISNSFLLARGATIRAYTGRSAPAGAIAIGRGAGIWNESGDTARLFNSADQQLSSTSKECEDTRTSTPDPPVPPVTNLPPAVMNVAVVCLSPSGSGDGFGEYVELRNDNSASVELKGLYLLDSVGNRLTIAATFSLMRDATVRVYTGNSAPTGAIAIGRGTGIWNESGDTARLFNSADQQLSSTSEECEDTSTSTPMMPEPPGETNPPPAVMNVAVVCLNLDGAEDGFGEYVVLRNDNSASVELKGLYLLDSVGNRLTIAATFSLMRDATVRVYTGNSAPTGAIAIGRGTGIWNESGDTARLFNSADEQLSSTSEECEDTSTSTPMMPEPPGETNPPPAVMNVAVVCLNLDGAEDGFGEYVVLRNDNSASVELKGLYFLDSADNRLTIEVNFSLMRDATVRVYTGNSAPTGAIAIGRGTGIWNESGDTATLFNSADEQLSSTSEECEDTSTSIPMMPEPPGETNPPPAVMNVAVVCLNLRGTGDEFGEYVVLRNDNSASVELKGVYLLDSTDNRLTIAGTFSLTRGATVRVYTGEAAPVGAIAIGRGTGIWNNTGDMARLFNSADQQLSSTSTECEDTSTKMPVTPDPPEGKTPPSVAANVVVVCLNLDGAEDEFGEYVVLRNDDSIAVELQDFYLRDAADNRLAIGDSFSLTRGATVRVYTGNNAPAGAIAVGRGSGIWNGGGDTATLFSVSDQQLSSTSTECEGANAEAQVSTTPDMSREAVVCLNLDGAGDGFGEYVVLRNDGFATIDLQGFYLRDTSASNRLTISSSFSLALGATVRVYTGSDAPAGAIAIGRGNGIWNKGGDTATLFSADDRQLSSTSTECEGVNAAAQVSTTPDPPDTGDPDPAVTNVVVVCLSLSGAEDEFGEYVVLRNDGSAEVDLQDFYLRDTADNRLTIGDSFSLMSGVLVRVYTGDDAPAGAIAIGRGSGIWNKGGDTATLFSADDRQLSSTSIECEGANAMAQVANP